MKTKLFYAGAVSMGIAAAFALLELTTIKASFNDTFLANVHIYPATFFALLGLLLMYFGLRPLWRN
jgi:hypothetical protein